MGMINNHMLIGGLPWPLIVKDGKVGIGTASPAQKLTIDGTTPIAEIKSGGYLVLRPTANDYDFRLQAVAYHLDFLAGGDLSNPRMTILRDGNIGIGTMSLTALLNLKGTLSLALTGTVAVTNASTTVTGTGTAFTTELTVGDAIKIKAEIFTVSAIASDTSLTLDSAYQGATESGLTAYKDPTLFAIDNGDAVNKLIVTRSGSIGIGAHFAYTEATTYKQLDVGSGGLIYDDANYSKALFHNDLSGDSTEWGFSSLVHMLSYDATCCAEKIAVMGIIRNDVSSISPNFVDGVGVLGKGYIIGTTTGRAWGLVGEALCPDPADNGWLIATELGIYNAAPVPTSVDDLSAKIALWIYARTEAPYTGATAAIAFANTDPAWVYGVYIRGVKDTFIRMENPDTGAVGIDIKTDAKWGAAMKLPNAAPIYFYNAAGTPKNMMFLNSNDDLGIGNDLGANKLWMNIDGVGRLVSLGANDSGSAGYRYLRVPNA